MQARSRRSPFRPMLLVAGTVVVFGAAAYIAVATALNPDQLRSDLQEAVLRQTGRELTVAGGVHLRFGLSPQFEMDDVSLANIPGGSRPQMLTARSVRARVALLPLLGGNAVISALTVEQPDLLLEHGTDGTPNWQFTPERRALYQGHGSGGGGGEHRVEIRALSLEGGQVGWRPAQGQPVTVAIGRLRVSADGVDSPMNLSFDGAERGVPITVKASSGSLQRLRGGPVSALAGAWPLSVEATAQSATLRVEGGVAHPEQGRGYQLRVKLEAPSLQPLNALFERPVLPAFSEVNASALLSDDSQGSLRTSQLAARAGASDLSPWVAGLMVRQASFSAPGPGQLAQLNVDGTYQNQPLRAAVTAMQPDIVAADGPVQVSVDAQAAGATLTAHGTMPPRQAASGLDLQVNLHAPDLSLLSPLAGRPLPPAHDLVLSAQIGDAGVKLRGVAVSNLALSSSLGDVAGQVTVVWSPRLDLAGTLSSRAINMDGLAPDAPAGLSSTLWPASSSSDSGIQPASPAPASSSPDPSAAAQPVSGPLDTTPAMLPLARLRTTDADLNLSIGELTIGSKRYTDLQARLHLQNGKLALNPFRAQTSDGSLVGGASIDASSDIPPVAVTLRSPSLAAEAVAAALGYPGGAAGTMQVDAQLSAVGQSVQAMRSSLDGHLGLAMVNGQVDDTLVQGLLGGALDAAGAQSFGGGTSQVRCLALRVDFRRGEGTVRAFAADTSRLALDGDGQVDLAAQTADLHLRPRIRLGPTEVAAPVSLRGPFGQMRASLDPVVGGGRYGLTIGSPTAGFSDCVGRLALARGGLGGPMPTPAAEPLPDAGLLTIRKPKDLLKGLFH